MLTRSSPGNFAQNCLLKVVELFSWGIECSIKNDMQQKISFESQNLDI